MSSSKQPLSGSELRPDEWNPTAMSKGNFMEHEEILACNVIEAARRLGVSPRTVATLVARKELRSRKIGRRRVIPIRALEEFLRRDHAIRPKRGSTTNKVGRDGTEN